MFSSMALVVTLGGNACTRLAELRTIVMQVKYNLTKPMTYGEL